ncbi:MAG: NADH-quinone oxidoreductase subunit C [Desulfomonile tiedjei]|nr:NADH-quinone oxidoreductase subunit C [Desulfomonile tiedjei]
MNQEQIAEKLLDKFGLDVVQTAVTFLDQITVTVAKEKILEVCTFLKEDPELAFNFLSFVAGVDRYPKTPRFEMVYQLSSLTRRHRFRIKALVEESEPGSAIIDSVFSIWPTADWHERETAEMFGITFRNHPDPRKLLLPEEWTCHPLRKDFSLYGTDEDTPDLPHKAGSQGI